MNLMVNRFKQLNKKQIVFLVLETIMAVGLVFFATFYKSTGEINIISTPDDNVVISGRDNIITQSYQIPDRVISGIELKINTDESSDICGSITGILSDSIEGTNAIGTNTLNLVPDQSSYRFDFKNTNIEVGRRYYLIFHFTGCDDATKICINTKSDYAGLTVNDSYNQGAIDASIYYSYSGNIAGLLKIVLVFTSIASLLGLVFDKNFAGCIAMSFGIVLIYLFVFGMIGMLDFGVNSFYFITCILMIALPGLSVALGKNIKDLFTPGLIGFWGLFGVYFILNRGVVLGMVDDLNHWQLCVRDMWFSDSYAYHIGNAYRVPRYVPAFATIEYFFLRLFGTYREGIILLACNSIGFAHLSILFDKITNKAIHKIIPVAVIIAALPLMIFNQHYAILYVDAYLGIIGAYLFIQYFNEKESIFKILTITIGSIFVILTKEMGLVIAFTIYLIIAIDLLNKHKNFKKFIKDKWTVGYFWSGIISVASFGLWKIYCKLGEASLLKAFEATSDNAEMAGAGVGIASNETIRIVTDKLASGSKYFSPMDTIKSLFMWLIEGNANNSYGTPISCLGIIAIVISIWGLFVVLTNLDIKWKYIIGMQLLGFAIYLVALCATYIIAFNEDSAIPAEQRYIGSYILLIIIATIGMIVAKTNDITNLNGNGILMWMCALLIVFSVPRDHHFYVLDKYQDIFYKTWNNHREIADVTRTFADKEDNIFYIGYEPSEVNPHENYITFHNAIMPTNSQGYEDWSPVVSEDNVFYDYASVYTPESLLGLLGNYDYLYIRDFNDYFLDNYGAIFGDEEIICGGFYKISKDEDGNTLMKKIAYKNVR